MRCTSDRHRNRSGRCTNLLLALEKSAGEIGNPTSDKEVVIRSQESLRHAEPANIEYRLLDIEIVGYRP